MVKAIMIAGFVAACGFLGTIKAGELKERIVLLEDFRRMLLYLKGQRALFNDNGQWKVRCCVPTGGINEYGEPNSFTLTDYNGNNTVVVNSNDERFI